MQTSRIKVFLPFFRIQKNEVTVQILKRCDFHHELVSNGKVSARGQADLRFETNEVIAHVYVKNGDRVRKGQKAELDKFRLEQKLSQAEDALLKAELELKDVLIGQGYTPDDFSKVPEETMKLAKVKSGYEQSKSQYELTKRETEHATLVAPFDGIVANLFSKPYNLANTSEAFFVLSLTLVGWKLISPCWRTNWLLLKPVTK